MFFLPWLIFYSQRDTSTHTHTHTHTHTYIYITLRPTYRLLIRIDKTMSKSFPLYPAIIDTNIENTAWNKIKLNEIDVLIAKIIATNYRNSRSKSDVYYVYPMLYVRFF